MLTYLRTTYPETKIGILVPYPTPAWNSPLAYKLRDALFVIARKYGCAVLDTGDPDRWFCVGYADGLDPEIGKMLAARYTLDNDHPNALGHQMLADGFEAWLRGL